jgi:Uma2 family endonuclease
MQALEIAPLIVDTALITLRCITHEAFEQLCQDNPDLRLELTATGELVAMAPADHESANQNFKLAARLFNWNESTQLGEGFDSSGGFTLPSGAIRSPDVTWIEKSKFAAIPAGVSFPKIVPDFVIELRSRSDSLTALQSKMFEYRDNGVRLGWLINPQQKQVEVYRLEQAVEVLNSPTMLSGEAVLPGFELNLDAIW